LRCQQFYVLFQLSPSAMSTFLEATVAALQPSQMPVVRIAAARAVWGFCSHIKQNKRTSTIDLVNIFWMLQAILEIAFTPTSLPPPPKCSSSLPPTTFYDFFENHNNFINPITSSINLMFWVVLKFINLINLKITAKNGLA
jgi:hypothetical protein